MSEENINTNFDPIVLQLGMTEQPIVTEPTNTTDKWVAFGENNDYYDHIIGRYRNSTTNNAVINNISRLIYGKGLDAIDASMKPGQFAAMKMLFPSEVVRKVSIELKMLGQCAFQVHYNDSHTQVIKVDHFPVHLLRAEKVNDDGDIVAYWWSSDWSNLRDFPAKRIPSFGTSKEAVEICFIRPYSVGMVYYSTVDYQGSLPYAVLEEEISDYLINDVQNGFSGTTVVNFPGVPSEERREITKAQVINKLTGAKGEKVIVGFNADGDKKTTVEKVPLDNAPDHYNMLSTEAKAKILNGHNVVSPMIVGIEKESSGFGDNGAELRTASSYFYNTVVVPFQDLLIDGIDKILAVNGIMLDLFFRRLDLLEDLEAKRQQKEETTLKFERHEHMHTLLDEFGEEEDPEEWVLVDEREVDYDDEDRLNDEVSLWDLGLTPGNKLIYKLKVLLASTGIARGNARSTQDAKIGDSFFKVRYQYDGSGSPDREFCKLMMSAKKIYRKEDVIRMGAVAVNPGFGEDGSDTYSIWLYKGGARCEHKWKRKTYMSKTRSIDVNSPLAPTISTNRAESFGYRVRNDRRVAMKPTDMPMKGFSPRNTNKPSDAQ